MDKKEGSAASLSAFALCVDLRMSVCTFLRRKNGVTVFCFSKLFDWKLAPLIQSVSLGSA